MVPVAVDARWETENLIVWNEQQHTSEERELVYEISWIAELGAWRRFLRSQRKADELETDAIHTAPILQQGSLHRGRLCF